MDTMDDDTFTQIEGRLRADYQRCFPLSVGWEKVATHLLLAYDFAVRGADVCTIDRMKYALMHALRWGHDSRSQPFGGYPGNFDPNLFKRCQDVLHRGVEYVGIWGALRLCCEGVVKTQRIEENRIEFTASPSWKRRGKVGLVPAHLSPINFVIPQESCHRVLHCSRHRI